MRLGDFRKETADLPDDTILDGVMYIIPLPSYYDGMPIDYFENKAMYASEPKIRFYMFDNEEWFWEVCQAKLSYDENLIEYLKVYVRGKNIENDIWGKFQFGLRKQFDNFWDSEEWRKYRNNELTKENDNG